MEEDLPPSPFIKKRIKGGIKTSNSSSSLRSLGGSTSNLSFKNQDDDEEEEELNVSVIRSSKKSSINKLKGKEINKIKSRLSFGDNNNNNEEEEEESFSIKRSTDSPNRRLLRPTNSTLSLKQETIPTSLDQANISTNNSSTSTPVRSVYSKEYLNQLKATTNSATPPSNNNNNNKYGGEYDELTRSKFGDTLNDTPSSIPTTAAIAEAKERRERMRAQGGGTGSDAAFISLDVGMVLKGGESRLVREEDELGDGDEDMADFTGAKESIPLGKKANKIAADKMRSGMVEMIQDAEEEDEDDEESREWELAQIRRGEERRRDNGNSTPSKRPYRATPIPTPIPMPSISSVSSRLSTALSTLQVSHTMDSAALNHFTHERIELDSQEKELRTEVEKVGEKNRWFSDFKIFIEEVAAFLDEKVPALEKVEKDNLAIQKERYEIVTRRRYEDDSDDVALFTGAQVATVYSSTPKDPSATIIEEPEFDEMGRSRREDDTAPLSSVRTARRAARERRIIHSAPPPSALTQDDYTDDELSPGDATDLTSAIVSLKESLALIFSDVKSDDFRNPNLGIRKKFEEWRMNYGDEYRNAFGGLALVGVWEFWARVEMALWNPFEISQLSKTPAGLDAYSWHSSLNSYGHSGRSNPDGMNIYDDDEEEDEQEDESQEVINALVTSVVIPRLEKLARETYDPLSKKQTTRALGLVEEVSYCVEKSSARFESLIQSFLSRLQSSISQSQSLIAPHLSLISLPTNAFDPSTFLARNHFAARQLKLLTNSLRWRRYAKNLKLQPGSGETPAVGAGGGLDELLVRELVAKVMLPVIEASWSTGGMELAAKVLAILPSDSLPGGLKKRLEGN